MKFKISEVKCFYHTDQIESDNDHDYCKCVENYDVGLSICRPNEDFSLAVSVEEQPKIQRMTNTMAD